MLIDTHVHFDLLRDHGLAGVLERAEAAGVAKLVAIGGAAEGNRFAVDLAETYPGRICAAVGFDRDQAGGGFDSVDFENLATSRHVVAIGEVGLDYHYHPETAPAQKVLLGRMLDVAGGLSLPVVVHTRNADRDTVDLLSAHAAAWRGDPERIGVVHCFTGDSAFAGELLALGFYISFSGIVTFSKAGALRETAGLVPDNRLLIETDSPFLAPEPYRGKKNEPAFVARVAEVLATVRGEPVEKIAELTTANAIRLFGMGL